MKVSSAKLKNTQPVSRAKKTSNRDRYAARGQDEESGFYYDGAQYDAQYSPAWLREWASTDPVGVANNLNLYQYDHSNSIMQINPDGGFFKKTYRDWFEISISAQRSDVKAKTDKLESSEKRNQNGEFSKQAYDYRFEISISAQGSDVKAKTDKPKSSKKRRLGVEEQITQLNPEESELGQRRDKVAAEVAEAEPTQSQTGLLNAGAASVTTWDSIQRGRYNASNAARAADAINRIRDAKRAHKAVRAWKIGKEASEARNAARVATQQRLSPGGRAMSEAIDKKWLFEDIVKKYVKEELGAGKKTSSPPRDLYIIAERVAEGSGRSNKWMSILARGGRVVGPLGIAVGLWSAARNIYNAPPDARGRVVAGEIGNFAGGLLGGALGTTAGVVLAGGVNGFLIGLGIVTLPVSWLPIVLGILGGLASAWAFGNWGRELEESAYGL